MTAIMAFNELGYRPPMLSTRGLVTPLVAPGPPSHLQHTNPTSHQSSASKLLMHGLTPQDNRVLVAGNLLLLELLADLCSGRILSHAIQSHVLDSTLLPTLLRTGRSALFPNNAPAPPRIIPTASEQLLIRQRCAQAILTLIPARIQDVYFGAGIDRRVREVEEVLNVFGDRYCNKHLLYGVVELIIVRLIPEMAEKGVEELLQERLN